MDDKWKTFKNWLHSEFSKEEIRDWIREAVNVEVERLVRQEAGKFSIEQIMQEAAKDALADEFSRNDLYGNRYNNLRREVIAELTKNIELKFVEKEIESQKSVEA